MRALIANMAAPVMLTRHFQHNHTHTVEYFVLYLTSAKIIQRAPIQNLVSFGIDLAAGHLLKKKSASEEEIERAEVINAHDEKQQQKIDHS